MRSAKEYRKQFNLSDESSDELGTRCDDIDAAINEARYDVIKECAKRATFEMVYKNKQGEVEVNNKGIFIAVLDDGQTEYKIDKQSILSLINELK